MFLIKGFLLLTLHVMELLTVQDHKEPVIELISGTYLQEN